MPSKPYNRPLKKINHHPKPVTNRQHEFVEQKKKNEHQIRRTRLAIPKHGVELSMNSRLEDQNEDDWQVGEDHILHNPDQMNIDDQGQNTEDVGDDHGLSDPESDSDVDSDDEVLSGLLRVQYDAQRLRREVQWTEQCALIIPSFLRCRQMTSNWGHLTLWNEDFKRPCSCSPHRLRTTSVALVDLLSQLLLTKRD